MKEPVKDDLCAAEALDETADALATDNKAEEALEEVAMKRAEDRLKVIAVLKDLKIDTNFFFSY